MTRRCDDAGFTVPYPSAATPPGRAVILTATRLIRGCGGMTDTDVVQHLVDELDRARSDYLAVSRNAHLYSSDADHQEAEDRAWKMTIDELGEPPAGLTLECLRK